MRYMVAAILLSFASAASAATPAERGEYIVRNLGMCGDCHTPRNAKGELIESAWLRGAAIDLRPVHPMPFAVHAPPIAGLPAGYTSAQLARFLATGLKPDGSMPRLPMPPYRMSPEDAAAVVTYLETLR